MTTAPTPPRLTAFASGGGCATKIAQADLAAILAELPLPTPPPELLAGIGPVDDAAVYRLSKDTALVFTTDFFAPVVDDPDDYGGIAAANALSDVYAMGGRPLLALNLVAWPAEDVLPASVLAAVLRGAAATVAAAGAMVVGGHSIRDAEPKFGLAVLGVVHPDAVTTSAAGRPGDVLVLTKALGTGVVSNATKLGRCPAATAAVAIASMRRLNAAAAAAGLAHGVRAATDVTGFGLLGHARNLGQGAGCAVVIEAPALPVLPGVGDLVDAGLVPGGSRNNLAFASTWTRWEPGVTELQRVIATDAQTSGGLLLCVAFDRAAALVAAIIAEGGSAWEVGRLERGTPGAVRVVTHPVVRGASGRRAAEDPSA